MLKCLFFLHTHTGYTERTYEKEMNQRDSIRRFIIICSLNRNSMCLDVTCNWLSVRCACAATTLTLATVNWVEMIQWWHTHMHTYTWSAFCSGKESTFQSQSTDRLANKNQQLTERIEPHLIALKNQNRFFAAFLRVYEYECVNMC